MKTRATLIAWSLWAGFLALGAAGFYLAYLNPRFKAEDLGLGLAFVGYPTVGALIASRQPKNAVGWIFIAFGLGPAAYSFSRQYATYALVTAPGALPGARWMAWLSTWISLLTFALGMTFLLLLYPNGKLLSRRWRPVAWTAGISIGAMSLSGALAPGPIQNFGMVTNPVGIQALEKLGDALWLIFTILPLLGLISVGSLIVRFRRSKGEERLQLKWFTYVVMIAATAVPVGIIGLGIPAFAFLPIILLGLAPVAVGVAILRHRLFDIDLIINKTLVYGLLGAVITGVYVVIVFSVGAMAGWWGKGVQDAGGAWHPNPTLQIVGTAAVALAFQPAKWRLQRFANRLVYGKRATPYEVMSELSHRMAATVSVDEVLPGMAEAAAHGVRAARTQVTVLLPGGKRRSVRYPFDSTEADFEHTVPVLYLGEAAGEIAVAQPPGEHLSVADTKLLEDFASQAGVVLHNLRLTAELQARLEEITAQAADLTVSSQRIVAAQNEERRRLEHAIHLGPQEQLSTIQTKILQAQMILENDPPRAGGFLEDIGTMSKKTLEALRDLAHGVFPRLLADKGLVEALAAQGAKAVFPVKVLADPDIESVRFDSKTEATVYFCCAEALAAAGQRPPTNVTISLRQGDGFLKFEVVMEGFEFDLTHGSGLDFLNMSDRVEALGGTLNVGSLLTTGEGTTIKGQVPARVLTPA